MATTMGNSSVFGNKENTLGPADNDPALNSGDDRQ
jgi:hypothetical protein